MRRVLQLLCKESNCGAQSAVAFIKIGCIIGVMIMVEGERTWLVVSGVLDLSMADNLAEFVQRCRNMKLVPRFEDLDELFQVLP